MIAPSSLRPVGFDVLANLLLKMQLAAAHCPVAFAALTNEKHLHATEPDLHVGNLLGHYLLLHGHFHFVVADDFHSLVQVLVVVVVDIVRLGLLFRHFVHFHQEQRDVIVFVTAA